MWNGGFLPCELLLGLGDNGGTSLLLCDVESWGIPSHYPHTVLECFQWDVPCICHLVQIWEGITHLAMPLLFPWMWGHSWHLSSCNLQKPSAWGVLVSCRLLWCCVWCVMTPAFCKGHHCIMDTFVVISGHISPTGASNGLPDLRLTQGHLEFNFCCLCRPCQVTKIGVSKQ